MSLEQDLFGSFLSDEDKSLKGAGAGLKFGLNKGEIIKFEYNPNSGKDNSPANALDIVIKIGEREVKQKIFETTRVFGKNGEITDTKSEEYVKAYTEDVKQKRGVITHFLKIFFEEEELKDAMSKASIKSFVDLFKFAQRGVEIGLKNKGPEVDVFLQYQWQIATGQEITFLELPKNLKDGAFICKSIAPEEGSWKEVRDSKGLHYEDEKGNVHRFTRDKAYLESPKGVQQKSSSAEEVAGTDMGGAGTSGGGW